MLPNNKFHEDLSKLKVTKTEHIIRIFEHTRCHRLVSADEDTGSL
jgi:hypothetical protein